MVIIKITTLTTRPAREEPPATTAMALGSFVRQHLQAVGGLAMLLGTSTFNHPVFGVFDAHKWHCMFSFHLKIHYKQAQHVVRLLEPHA